MSKQTNKQMNAQIHKLTLQQTQELFLKASLPVPLQILNKPTNKGKKKPKKQTNTSPQKTQTDFQTNKQKTIIRN